MVLSRTLIPWLPNALGSVLNGFFGAIAYACHTMGAIASPGRLSVCQADIAHNAFLCAQSAAIAGIKHSEILVFNTEISLVFQCIIALVFGQSIKRTILIENVCFEITFGKYLDNALMQEVENQQ